MLVLRWSDEARRSLAELVRRRRQPASTTVVAVDGLGGAGKSTVADGLAAEVSASVVHLDEIATWPDGPDWDRLQREVLAPLIEGRGAHYVAWDWSTMRLNHHRSVAPGGIVIVEGSGSAASRVTSYVSLAIWVECPHDLRFERTIQRDGSEVIGAWKHWSEWEKKYLTADDPRPRVDAIVTTGPHGA